MTTDLTTEYEIRGVVRGSGTGLIPRVYGQNHGTTAFPGVAGKRGSKVVPEALCSRCHGSGQGRWVQPGGEVVPMRCSLCGGSGRLDPANPRAEVKGQVGLFGDIVTKGKRGRKHP